MKKIKLLNKIFWIGSIGVISIHVFTGMFMSKESEFFEKSVQDIYQKVDDNKSIQEQIAIKRELLIQASKEPQDRDYTLAVANSLAILIKNELLFMNKEVLKEHSNIPNLIKSVDNVFNSELTLKPEAKDEFNLMLSNDQYPLDTESIERLKKDLAMFKLLLVSKYPNMTESTQEYLNILEKHYNDLSSLANEQGLAIYNKWKTLRSNEQFQNLVFSQDIQQVWDTYFKSEFGDSVSPVIYFVTGTFQK